MLTVKRFFAYSIALHSLFIIAALSFVPPGKVNREEPFFARLVSPEELLARAPLISSLPELRPALPAKPKASVPSPQKERSVPEVPEQGVSVTEHSPATASKNQGIEGMPPTEGSVQKPDFAEPPMGGNKPESKGNVRDKIFDMRVIGEIAKRDIEREEKKRTFTFDVKKLRYLGYLQRLKERIESIWLYPPSAAERGIYGDLVIRFTIKKNGRLGAVELVRTSGHKSLDDAALRALEDAEPFWPLPDEWRLEAYTITGHFIYTIYGYYLR